MIGKVDERDLPIAHVYARSLLALSEEGGVTDQVGQELRQILELLDSSDDLADFLVDPLVDEEQRARVLETVFRPRFTGVLVDALQVMSAKGRLNLFRALAEAYRLEVEELRGEIDVKVATAVPLSESQRAEVSAAAAKLTGLKPRLFEQVDEDLLGGMVVRIGDRKFDTSLSKELHQLSERLVTRASTEIHDGRRFYAEADGEQI